MAISTATLEAVPADTISRHCGFEYPLDEFEAAPAADDAVSDRDLIFRDEVPDHLVHGVVPPEVFSGAPQLAVEIKRPSRVKPTGPCRRSPQACSVSSPFMIPSLYPSF